MKAWTPLILCAALTLAVGCGSGPDDNPVEVQNPTAVEEIKLVLNEVIESGNPLGSQGYTLEYNIEQLGETDPAKAEQLNAAYLELRDMSNSSELKAKAKEMLEML
jgi:hypothetical protein